MYITDIRPQHPTALHAYFLGRPVEVYRRRYRRAPASITRR